MKYELNDLSEKKSSVPTEKKGKKLTVTSDMFKNTLNCLLKNDSQKQMLLSCFVLNGGNKCQLKK